MNSIQMHRLQKGWTIRELTERLGAPSGAVSSWERGKEEPNFAQLRKLTEVFGCSADELIAEDTELDTSGFKEWREALEPIRKRMAELQRIKLDTDNELKAMQMALSRLIMGGTGVVQEEP